MTTNKQVLALNTKSQNEVDLSLNEDWLITTSSAQSFRDAYQSSNQLLSETTPIISRSLRDDPETDQEGSEVADAIHAGGSGDDMLTGGEGDDRFSGGAGDDLLWGGGGLDKYFFSGEFGNDTIRDFDIGETLRFDDGSTIVVKLNRSSDTIIHVFDETGAILGSVTLSGINEADYGDLGIEVVDGGVIAMPAADTGII